MLLAASYFHLWDNRTPAASQEVAHFSFATALEVSLWNGSGVCSAATGHAFPSALFVPQELCLIRFHPATEEEEVAYISLYSYFSSRGRFGVVANNSRHVKDLYLIPLSGKDPIPSRLLPFEGPGKHQLCR